jgi:hypothetical protein
VYGIPSSVMDLGDSTVWMFPGTENDFGYKNDFVRRKLYAILH